MSDFETANIPIVNNNLTFFDPQQAPLNLQVLDLKLTREDDEVLECCLTILVEPEIYRRIDTDALFNLNPEFRIPLSQKLFSPDRNIVLHICLQPDLLCQLSLEESHINGLERFTVYLSQNEPSSPLLSTENWLGLSVTQGLEPNICGYQSIWSYIKPSDMNEEALCNGKMTEVVNQFIAEQIKTNFAKFSLGENSELQSEIVEFVKQLVNQEIPNQPKRNSTKSKKQKKSKSVGKTSSSEFSNANSSELQSEITDLINQLVDVNLSIEENTELSSDPIFEILVEFFRQDNWDFVQTEGETVLRTIFQGDNGQWSCYAWALEEKRRIAFYSICPVHVSENYRHKLAELITRCNYCLLMGNFEMDFLDGEIRFKTSIDVNGDRLTFALLRQLIYTNVLTMDRYLPAIMSVIYGNASPEQAIAQIEG